MTGAVLLAHGSPDPRSAAAVRRAADGVATRCRLPVVAAFLDHEAPDLAGAAVAQARGEPLTVLPLLLSTAFHARVDVPAAVDRARRQGAHIDLLPPLGHPERVLGRLLADAGRPSAVVAAGTGVAPERARFGAAVASASRRTGIPAWPAFASGPGPRLDELDAAEAVVPWLLGPGRLLDAVADRAAARGLPVLGGALLERDDLLDELARRLPDGSDGGCAEG